MDIAVAQQFLRENENAVLATWRRDGRVQMSPVTVGLDGAGRAIIASAETTEKVRNLRRDPRATLCVFVEAFTGPWVQIEGTAEVVTLPEAMEPLVDYYRRLAGEHPDWEDYRRAMIADRRALDPHYHRARGSGSSRLRRREASNCAWHPPETRQRTVA